MTEENIQKIEEVAAETEKETAEDGKKLTGKKKKQIRQISHGRAYVQATYNNTIVTLTDLNGNVLSWSSAGQNNFKGPKKATPYAASVIVKDAVDKSKPYGLKNVNVFVKGVGSGREAAVRALNTYGLNVVSIKDITPIPHNGCRHRRPRRV
ncbi:MAG: 30S ribosomal protein S11 [Candidatus Parcubacteria bacterium]|nr:30S ribosomal protein S11 [Candidatus Parcubacteria bacterium]